MTEIANVKGISKVQQLLLKQNTYTTQQFLKLQKIHCD